MRVHVDPERGQGHDGCCPSAPELFDVDDPGTAFELHDGLPPEQREGTTRRGAATRPASLTSISERVA